MFQPQFRPCRRNSFTPYSYLQLWKRQAGQLLTSKEVASPGIYKYATEAETSRERDLKKMTRPPILFVVRSPRLRRGLRIFSAPFRTRTFRTDPCCHIERPLLRLSG